jgi:hypothetical protein
MAVGRNVYSDITSIVPSIFEDVCFIARDNMIMPGLVKNFSDRTGAAVRDFERYGSVLMGTVSDGDDLVSQQFAPSSISTVTPAEYGAQVLLTDLKVESDPFNSIADAKMELGLSFAQKLDTDLLGRFNEFTAGTIGATGSALTWNYVFAMQAILRQANAPLPYTFVATPYQIYRLGVQSSVGNTVTNSPGLQDALAEGSKRVYMGNFYGINIYSTGYCEASGNDAYAGMFSPSALALDWRRAPRLEVERDASRRATELNFSAVIAQGVWRKEWGVAGLFVNSAVTGV